MIASRTPCVSWLPNRILIFVSPIIISITGTSPMKCISTFTPLLIREDGHIFFAQWYVVDMAVLPFLCLWVMALCRICLASPAGDISGCGWRNRIIAPQAPPFAGQARATELSQSPLGAVKKYHYMPHMSSRSGKPPPDAEERWSLERCRRRRAASRFACFSATRIMFPKYRICNFQRTEFGLSHTIPKKNEVLPKLAKYQNMVIYTCIKIT